MYNIVEEINDLHNVIIKQSGKKDIFIPIKGLHVNCYNREFDLPAHELDIEELSHIYNNLTITSNLLSSELILLQDYGDHEGYGPENTIEIPRWLLFRDNGSIGWYDGYLIYSAIIGQDLVVYKLTEYPKIDLSIIRDKRPFNMWTVTKIEANNAKVFVAVFLKSTDDNPNYNKWIFIDMHLTYEQLTAPGQLESLPIDFYYGDRVATQDHFISRDLLVINGWSYNASNHYWYKDEVHIIEDGVTPINNYYHIDSGDYIFTMEELKYYQEHGRLDKTN